MMELTNKQEQVLAFTPARNPCRGRAPSYCEIADYQGVAVRAAYQHARALERKGALTSALRHSGIRLSPEHVPPAGLPIIGRVAAGTPMGE